MSDETLFDSVCSYIKKEYDTDPEYLWSRFPGYAVFRHLDNRKWFAIIMDVPRNRLGLEGDERVDIINLKLSDPMLIDFLTHEEGYLIGYHISNGNWISILLDGTVPLKDICNWIDESFANTASRQNREKFRAPREWIVPANPKYYDIVHAFDSGREIIWKQGRGIRKNDKVFVYSAAPVSAILYRCKVIETDIPYDFDNGELRIDRVMKIRLEKRYRPTKFTFSRLNGEFGIRTIRGPIGVSHSLSEALK